jgi:hypothetical protein
MSGLKIAALYGIYPHQLGHCGSRRKSIHYQIYDFLCGKKVPSQKIRKILEGFKGAFFYYKLIARANGITSPFDEKVVKAYWIGNSLLDKVKTEDLRKMIAKDFSKPGLLPKKTALKKAKEIPESSKPHHSFHVLMIGSVTGRIKLKGKLLDLCRVGWGKVIKKLKSNPTGSLSFRSIQENSKLKILVKYQPLIKKNKKLKLGKPVEKEIFWDKNLVPKIKIGDWVSFHWDHLVQKLKKREVENFKKYTSFTLKLLENILK